MGVDASTWLDAEKRQSILSGAQGDSIAEHASAIWQDFDIALIMPEPYYDQRQYLFKIDTCASSEPRYTSGKVFSAMDVVECRPLRHSDKPSSKLLETVILRYASGAHTLPRSEFRAT